MRQYCRYCQNVAPGDYYCYVKEKCLDELQLKHVNKCPYFKFTKYDAINPEHEYEPRKVKGPDPNQIGLEF